MALILVADDDPFSREALAQALEGAVHRTVGRADGAAAVELVDRHTFEAVVSDVRRPEEDDGSGLLRSLRLRPGRPAVPLASGCVRQHALDLSRYRLALGADDVVGKPFAKEERLGKAGALPQTALSAGEAQR